MSRIFDALQRSGVEQSGMEYDDAMSVVTEVFEARSTAVWSEHAIADQTLRFQCRCRHQCWRR